jgi:hypothetical protein
MSGVRALIAAEILKLRRRRGLMIWSWLLTVGAMLIALIVLVALHAANPAHHGPAGGWENLEHYVFLIAGLGDVTAILIGATAGTQDVSAGVFRDLAVTGRSRATLFGVRAVGAYLVLLPMLAVAFAIAIVASFALAGDIRQATGGEIGHYVAYTVAVTAVNTALAVGIGAFASSRVVVGVLIAWSAIVAQILISLGSLGGARKLIDVAAAQHFATRHMNDDGISMSTATAVVVLVVWAGIALAAGRRWTQRIDA